MPVLRSSSRLQPAALEASSPTRRSRLADKDINFSPSVSPSHRVKNKVTSKTSDIIEISSDEESGLQQSAIIADLHRQIARLKDENVRQKRDLDKYRKQRGKSSLDIAKIEDNLHCEICIMRLWSPCVLPECGHIFCQSCLRHDSNPIMRNPRLFATSNTPRPQYSCPTCRMAVSMKPAEVYALKAIVRAVASVAGEKSPRKNTNGKQRRSPEGVWARFFPM